MSISLPPRCHHRTRWGPLTIVVRSGSGMRTNSYSKSWRKRPIRFVRGRYQPETSAISDAPRRAKLLANGCERKVLPPFRHNAQPANSNRPRSLLVRTSESLTDRDRERRVSIVIRLLSSARPAGCTTRTRSERDSCPSQRNWVCHKGDFRPASPTRQRFETAFRATPCAWPDMDTVRVHLQLLHHSSEVA
jgi:hypothetical protein